jgi:hypothetical protein
MPESSVAIIPTKMPTNPELTAARDLVYQGVGRNVLQFQRLELLLKRLLGWHQAIYNAETFEEDLMKRLEAQDKKTFGMLAGELFDKVFQTGKTACAARR